MGLLVTPFVLADGAKAAEGDQVKLRIMETTDLHTNVFPYDYYRGTMNQNVGLLKTATLIEQAHAEAKNSVLVDNGDTIQGTPLGTYFAKVEPVKEGEIHPMIKVMNELDYDMVTLGNHEFNYGLDFMEQVYGDANFGYVSANTYVDDGDDDPSNDQPAYDPYKIVPKTVIDEEGNEQTINVGYIGFVAPQIVQWDKANLDGKIISKDIAESAEKYVPQMKAEGADVIIAIAHTGFDQMAEKGAFSENAILPLSEVEGIDAITFSHTHNTFPAPAGAQLSSGFKDANGVLPYIDADKGTINGVPAVQAGFGGGYLGLIDLTLEEVNGEWEVTDSQSANRSIANVEINEELASFVEADHQATISYSEGKLGTTTAPIYSFFALVEDDPSVQIVTDAQKWYVEEYIRLNSPELADTPILSAGAPFKAGRNSIEEYTDIAEGDLTIRSAGDLYLYDNTLKAVQLTGAQVREWLEMSAGKFNQVDPDSTEQQELLNPDFPAFNFDVIDGVTYEIDITQPAKYNNDGTLKTADANRIVNLEYNGEPVSDDQEFIVITNNYRAGGGGNFPGLADAPLVVDSAEENRQILMDYITELGEVNPSADQNWQIKPIDADLNVTFLSSPAAEKYADGRISYTGETDERGFGVYRFSMKSEAEVPAEPTFSDVPAEFWAAAYINDLSEKNVVKGYANGMFKPNNPVLRGQFLSMVVRSLGLSDGELTLEQEIELAIENGITTRTTATFNPYERVTREQMVAMLMRAYEVKNGEAYDAENNSVYTDRGAISSVFTEYIDAATELGYISGRENGSFDPRGTSTRAHAAKVLSLFLK